MTYTIEDRRSAFRTLTSTMVTKIVASAIFLDFDIVEAITGKHRDYPASYVIPVKKVK